jgi:SAM-dependent methyltransferase
MQNIAQWKPTKFVVRKGRLRSSTNPSDVAVGSRLMADMVAAVYADLIPRFATGALLDVGCGTVPLYGTYSPYVSEIVCVDWSNSAHSGSHIDQVVDLTAPLPLNDSQFDTLIISDVLEHIPNPMDLWREIFRVCRPGAVVLCNTPFYYWLHEEPHDYYRYTRHALSRFSSVAGFETVEISEIGGLPEILGDLFAKIAVRLPAIGSAVSGGLQSAVYWAGRSVPLMKKLSSKSARAWPFGYVMVARKPS